MKSLYQIIVLIVLIFTLSGCNSLVTLQDVQKQEESARKAIEDAREETVELAQVKTEYSEDKVTAAVDELEDEQKSIKKDLKKLKGIETESAVGTTEGTVKNLDKRSKEIDREINKLKSQKTENWEETVERIEQLTQSLRTEVDNIVANTK